MTNTEERSFYRGSQLTYQIIGGIAALAMIALSIYLTKHYFDVKFPTGLTGGGLCNINAFFNCDVATHSHLSNIAGVPISLIGILMGLFVLFGFLFNNEKVEGTIHFLLWFNAIGCAVLFLFSLIVLGGLCPACTLYYIASFVTLFAFYKSSSFKTLNIATLASFGAVYLIIFGVVFNNVSGRIAKETDAKSKLAKGLISQFESLPNLGSPEKDSEFIMAKTDKSFKEARVRITKFSDFECPACKMLSDILHKIAKKYEGKVAIQYFFYPLDNNCNPEMQRPLHQSACKAAYLAACLPEKFAAMEAEIFSNQQNLSAEWIEKRAKEEGVLDCYNSKETQEKVLSYINASKPFNVKSTPTFILNGIKIEGVLPENQLSILIDHILSK
ncbi:MAG: thioredoxin domain-containing protein [Bacteriovoracaceae bacterium]|nr:thioredoxin domain-containing protein [Bacteriovoracaceae bacterium]